MNKALRPRNSSASPMEASAHIWVAMTLMFMCTSALAAGAACSAPTTLETPQARGSGQAISLKWDAHQDVRRYRVWAQWRVPEGEVLLTHEVVLDTNGTELPPSPARWRPLKLSMEIQSLCEGGAVSAITRLRQLQFDVQAQAVCPPVEGVQFDRVSQRLVWKGNTHDRYELSFHKLEDGQTQSRQEIVGTTADWPALAGRPAVIRALRACGEAQRSQVSFLLVR